MTAVVDSNIPPQVAEDGRQAQEEIDRLRAERSGNPPGHPATDEAAVDATVPPVAGQPTYGELEESVKKLTGDLEAQRREFDRKWGERGANMERLTSLLAQREDDIKALKAEIDILKARPGKADEPAPPEQKTMDQSIADLYTEYGEDFINGIKRLVGQDLQAIEKKLAEQDTKIRSMTEKQDHVSAARAFWEDFEKLSPGALALNGDPVLGVPANPAFLKYLDEQVPIFEGSSVLQSRRKIAEQLSAEGNLNDLARIFQGFKPTQLTEPQPGLAEKVSPKTVRTVGSDTPVLKDGKPVYLESEIDRFYRQIQEGLEIPEAELKQKTAEFNRAAAEGRVVLGR